jgi:uncharacterized protein (TIGR02598 family)
MGVMNSPDQQIESCRRKSFQGRRVGKFAGCTAFTLIEVLLSLGIVSFAFMALCGVLPVGLRTYREAMDATCRANIVRVITAELAQAPYGAIDALEGKDRFFSDQGLEVAADGDARFRVKYENVLAAASVFGATNSSLKPVTVDIFSVPDGRAMSRVTVFIADNGT